MNIRLKLAIQFTILVTIILIFFSLGIHFFSQVYTQSEFSSRLKDKLMTTAKLLINVREVNYQMLKIIDRNSSALPEENIIVLNEKNKLIYSSNDTIIEHPSETLLTKIRKKHEYNFYIGKRQGIGITYSYQNRDYIILAVAYDKYGILKMRNLALSLFIGLFLGVVVSFVIGYFFANRALQPIQAIVDKVNTISASNLNLRLEEGNGHDEIARLSKTFNQMLQRIEHSFVLQRDFVANASHELRTPVTIIIAEIDYLLMQTRNTDDYIKSLNTISEDLKNFNNTLNSLFVLTLASLERRNLDKEYLRVDELLILARNEIMKSHPEYFVDLDYSEIPDDENKLVIYGNENLLKIAFKNLIDNGCKYSGTKSVYVSFSFENGICIKFKDDGIGISANEFEQIFQPFYRGTRSSKGHGLGLPLVKRIVELHSGDISVDSIVGKGSTFSVIFKFKS